MDTILVIDDDKDLLVLTKKELELYGYRVLVAQDGEEGFLQACQEKPDLLLLDVNMPGKDGFTVLREIRKSDAAGPVPIIMLTAAGDVSSMVRSRQEGATDYFIKSSDSGELLKAIKRYII